MKKYFIDMWDARYFWLHLTRAELKYKFRRSKLGLLWTMITPLVLTLMMSIIFGTLFGVNMKEFAPYVFSGLIVWDFIIGSVVGGCNSFISAESYIRQYKHPLAIYPLRTTLVNLSTFSIALMGMILWTLLSNPNNLIISIPVIPITMICLFIFGWPISIITSFTNIKYRDFSQISTLGMQFLWYMSPVFLQSKMFNNPLIKQLLEYNPITHVLNLIRAPMLYGKFPTFIDFAFVLGTAVILYIVAILRIRKSEKTLIFYL